MKVHQVLCAVALWTVVQTIARTETPVGRFVDVKPVAGLDSPVVDRSPSISKDGKTIYFSSSRPDNFTNEAEDIWVATRNNINDPFGPPARLDSPVNSDANEREPKISDDGMTLYFTSDRDGGSGGLDIWMATRDMPTGPFIDVTNLGSIVNSSSDDATIDISSDGRTAYFASNRPGGQGGSDLDSASRTENEIFGDLVNLASVNTGSRHEFGPSLSSDGQTMFFSVPGSMYVATREKPGDAFGNPVHLNNFSLRSQMGSVVYYPSVSDDWPANGSKLYFTSGPFPDDSDIYEATWVPEPSASALAAIGLLWGVIAMRSMRISGL